jgi:hypothetical protein
MSQHSSDNQKAGPSEIHWSHDNGYPVLTIGNPLDDPSATVATAIQEPITPSRNSPTQFSSQGSAPNAPPNEAYEPFEIHEALPFSKIQGNSELEAKRSNAILEAHKRWRSPTNSIPELAEGRPLSLSQARHYGTILHRVNLALRAFIKPSDIHRAETGDNSVLVLMHPIEFSILRDSFIGVLAHLKKEESREELLKVCPVPEFALKLERPTLVPFGDFVKAAALYRSEVETFIRLHSELSQSEADTEAAVRRQRRRTSGLSYLTMTGPPELSAIPESNASAPYKPISGSPSIRELPPHFGRSLFSSGRKTDRPLPYRPRNSLPQSHRLSELLGEPTFRGETPIQMPGDLSSPINQAHHYPGPPIHSSHSFVSTSLPQRPSSVRGRTASSIHRPSSVHDVPSSVTDFYNPNVSRQPPHLIVSDAPSAHPFNLPDPINHRSPAVESTGKFYTPSSQNRGLPRLRQALTDSEAEVDEPTRYSQHTNLSNQFPGSHGTAGFDASAGSARSSLNSNHSRQLSQNQNYHPPFGGNAPNPDDSGDSGSSSSDEPGGGGGGRGDGRGGGGGGNRGGGNQRFRQPPPLGYGPRDQFHMDQGIAPVPARAAAPQFDYKLKAELVPEWDGDPDALMRWMQVVNLLSERSPMVYAQLGDIVPLRLTRRASNWFYGLNAARRYQITENWGTLRQAIYDHFMNRSWMDRQKKRAFSARYRDSSAPNETPSDYFYRKLQLLNTVSDWTDSQLITEIMESAPDFWVQIIDTQRLESLEDLQDAIAYHEERLANSRNQSRDDRKVERLQEQVNSILNRMNRTNRPPYRNSTPAKVNNASAGSSKSGKSLIGTHSSIQPRFPKDDSNVTTRGLTPAQKGARSCRHCGSAQHWDNECKYAKKGNKFVRTNAANTSEDYLAAMDAYDEAYYGTSSSTEESSEEGDDDSEGDDEDPEVFVKPQV